MAFVCTFGEWQFGEEDTIKTVYSVGKEDGGSQGEGESDGKGGGEGGRAEGRDKEF